jgi:hypothetical protein
VVTAVQYGESVDVADWFSGFCAIHDSSDGSPEEEAQAAVVPKLKKRRGRPSKKVLQRVYPSARIALLYITHKLYKSTVYNISLPVDVDCTAYAKQRLTSELCHKRRTVMLGLDCTCKICIVADSVKLRRSKLRSNLRQKSLSVKDRR